MQHRTWHFALTGCPTAEQESKKNSRINFSKASSWLTINNPTFSVHIKLKKHLTCHVSLFFSGLYKVIVGLERNRTCIHVDCFTASFKSLPGSCNNTSPLEKGAFSKLEQGSFFKSTARLSASKLFCKLDAVNLSDVDEFFEPWFSKASFFS